MEGNTNNNTNTNVSVERAIEELAHRGVTNSTQLGTTYDATYVVDWCLWWDDQRKANPSVTTGLLVHKIKSGEEPPRSKPAKAPQLRDRFETFVRRHPIGSRYGTHQSLAQRKRWRDVDCPGHLLVVEAGYPIVELHCDMCELIASLTPDSMRTS